MSGIERSAAVATHTRVLAVDDDASFLAVLRDLVGATAHLEIAGEAGSGEEAVAVAQELAPDMVLMDVLMPGIGGMRAAEFIKAASPSTLIVMISAMHPDEIPVGEFATFAALVLWKSTLKPGLLDEAWLQHRAKPRG